MWERKPERDHDVKYNGRKSSLKTGSSQYNSALPFPLQILGINAHKHRPNYARKYTGNLKQAPYNPVVVGIFWAGEGERWKVYRSWSASGVFVRESKILSRLMEDVEGCGRAEGMIG